MKKVQAFLILYLILVYSVKTEYPSFFTPTIPPTKILKYCIILSKAINERQKKRVVRENCNSFETEKANETQSKDRDKELDTIRKKQQKESELEKDMFDIAVELGGLGS